MLTEKKENIIDLTGISPTGEVSAVFEELKNIIHANPKNRNSAINLGEICLTSPQIEQLKSIVGNEKMIYSSSSHTQFGLINAGFSVAKEIIKKEKPIIEKPENHHNRVDMFLSKASKEVKKDIVLDKPLNTLYIKQNLRSGQSLGHGGNIVLIGDCNSGSEISAGGDITVWGVLAGIAHAGIGKKSENCQNIIRALRINAIQLRIANKLARKPDRGFVERSEKNKDFFAPEEARIENGEIIIYTLNN